MPSAIVRAAATGLSSVLFDRRRMLLGLAAASTASAAAAAPVAVAAVTTEAAENAALLDLGNQTPAVLAVYREAVATREAIVREWGPQWPTLPDDIASHSSTGEVATDLEGNWPDRFARYLTRNYFEGRISERQGRWKKRFRKGTSPATVAKWEAAMAELTASDEARLALSDMYCAERRRIRETSGIRPAQIKETETREALISHVASIMEMEPVTMAGAIVQAEALEALSAVPVLQRGRMSVEFLQALPAWGERLAASILRIASSAA